MSSFWFIYYEVQYVNKEGSFAEIKGNGVFLLASRSFLPGSVAKILTATFEDKIKEKRFTDGALNVSIVSFAEISEEGYNDFLNTKSTSLNDDSFVGYNFSVSGQEFTRRNSTTLRIL